MNDRPSPGPDDLKVVYSVRATPATIAERALDLCVEQTVEVTEPLWRDPATSARSSPDCTR